MSYNIDKLSLKKLELYIPVGFCMSEVFDRSYENIVVSYDLRNWSYNEDGEGFSMYGVLKGGKFVVKKLDCSGEGSGNDFTYIVRPLFEMFKGNLIANIIWEAGDAVEKVIIENGEYRSEEIDF